jgi:hypothetical protein
MRHDIFYPNDPRFEPSAPSARVTVDEILVDYYAQDGEIIATKTVLFDYIETPDGLEVRVLNAGAIAQEDVKETIKHHLKTRVSSWDFVA